MLDGSLTLASGGEVLVWPTCCSDLGDISGSRAASAYRGGVWQVHWVGHPWLAVRFDGEGLVLSEHHESESLEVLARALDAAEAELVDFARRPGQASVGLG